MWAPRVSSCDVRLLHMKGQFLLESILSADWDQELRSEFIETAPKVANTIQSLP